MATLKVTVPENSQNVEGSVTIEAPLDEVFSAHTNPDLFTKWWGRGNPMKVHHFDCRSSGWWHITELSTAQSRAARDGMVASGMEAGWRQSIEALGKLVEK